MRTIKLTIQYDGTRYAGWQRQANAVTIQGLLENALARIEGAPVPVVGASRTDAGVHALAQVASCSLRHTIDLAALRRALNAMLPSDVRVAGAETAPEGFHARYAAQAKIYRYLVVQDEWVSPFLAPYVWHVTTSLDAEVMREAAERLHGRHDFASFQAAGSSVQTTVRTLTRLELAETATDCVVPLMSAAGPPARVWIWTVEGDGFLRHMVRNIVGTLTEIGAGRHEADAERILAARDRAAAGATAPASGLWLVGVAYGDDERFT